MKKLLTLTALLLAASLIFTACANGSSESDDGGSGGSKLPGTWVKASGIEETKFFGDLNKNGWTRIKNKINYTVDVSTLGIQSGYVSRRWLGFLDQDIYGVHVKIKQKAFTDTECGIMLFYSDDDGDANTQEDAAYYELTFWKGSYILKEKVKNNKDATKLSGDAQSQNTWNDAIKKEGNENDVLLYTEGDNLVLKVNGTTIKTFKKNLNDGACEACVVIPGNATGTMDVAWNFVEFQTVPGK